VEKSAQSLDDIIAWPAFKKEMSDRRLASPGQLEWWLRHRHQNGLAQAISERHGRLFVIRPRFVQWLASGR